MPRRRKDEASLQPPPGGIYHIQLTLSPQLNLRTATNPVSTILPFQLNRVTTPHPKPSTIQASTTPANNYVKSYLKLTAQQYRGCTKLYLSVLLWPKDGKLFVPLANKVTKAYLLTKPGTTLTTTTDANGVIVHVDGPAPDPVATEVVLDIDGTPELKGNNVITLSLSDAKLNVSNEKQGGYPHLKVGGTHAPYHLGPWFYDKDYAYWTAPVTQPGKFSVTMQYSLIAGPKGSTLSFSAGDQTLNIPIRSTSHWFRYRTAVVGNIDVTQAGNVQFTLKGQKGDGPQVANIRSIVMTPIIDE